MKTTTLQLRNLMNRSPLRRGLFLIPLVLACFALSPQMRAVCQDGCLTNENTVLGDDALINNTDIGIGNTAIGSLALSSNTFGQSNTAIGQQALAHNTTGSSNTATGFVALNKNTTGSFNTATGRGALFNNTLADNNTATGYRALNKNTTGHDNVATGVQALYLNTMGNFNTATGNLALSANTTGSSSTAMGHRALMSSTGTSNTAIGAGALLSNLTGSNNIALGTDAGFSLTAGSYNIDIGNSGVGGEANTIRIGTTGNQTNTYIAGISGATVPTGVAVIVDANGHLGTTTSSGRFKEAIKPMDKVSEAILALKPVIFQYKHELDPEGIPQFGLVAEQVEKVNPDLVARDDQGKPYSVRYEAVNAMLLNEFLKEHRKVEKLEATVAQQHKDFEAAVAELKGQIQKVSAQLELSKPAPQTVLNDQ